MASSERLAQLPHAKGRAWPYVRTTLLSLLALAGFLIACGATYQTVSTARDMDRFTPPGQLVDMGGYRLHLYCTGIYNPGDLTVVLESGLASTTSTWARIQNEVSATSRVCSYDRGGMGWSDPSPVARDGAGIARELHDLLRRAGVTGGLLLVGHSSGGLYVRAYQAAYPAQVAGLVLIDGSSENDFSATPDGDLLYRKIRSTYRLMPLAARLGLIRMSMLCDPPADFPGVARMDFRATCSRSSSWAAQKLEVTELLPSMERLRKQPKLGDLPLVVITGGSNMKGWATRQKQLVSLSTRGIQLVRPQASPPGLLLNAEDARYCSAAIQNLVSALTRPQTGS